MRTMTAALALGTALAMCTAAHADRHHRAAKLVRVPVVMSDSFWVPDYNIVPRYRYRPEDDGVDTSPSAKSVAPGEPKAGQMGPGS
jgi:hypothetical protein